MNTELSQSEESSIERPASTVVGEKLIPVSLEPKRLPKRIRKQEAIEIAEKQMARNLPKYLHKLEELAFGKVLLTKTTKEGDVIIYEVPPDRQALQFLIEHAKGKAPQRFELTGEDGGPMTVMAWAPPPITVVEGQLA